MKKEDMPETARVDLSRVDLSQVDLSQEETEQMLEAIRRGKVDAFVVQDSEGDRVYTRPAASAPPDRCRADLSPRECHADLRWGFSFIAIAP
jgi:hypothetical protein